MEKLFEFLLMFFRFLMFLKLIVLSLIAFPYILVKHFRTFGFFDGLENIGLPFKVIWIVFCKKFDEHIRP